MQKLSARSLALFILLILIWAYVWIVSKLALRDMGEFTFSAARLALAVVALFVALRATGRSLRPPPLKPALLLGMVQTFGYMTLMNWALVEGAAGKTSVLTFTMPFWTLLFAWILLRERLTRAQWPAIFLGLVGLLLVFHPWQGRTGPLFPQFLAVSAGAVWAAANVISKRIRATYSIDPLVLTAWQMLLGSIPAIALPFALHERPTHWTPYLVFAILYAGIAASALAWLLWLLLLSILPAGVASINVLAVPVLSVLVAWFQLHERPTATEFAGMAVIGVGLASLALANMKPAAIPAGTPPPR